jgi:uncharacterized protein YbcI
MRQLDLRATHNSRFQYRSGRCRWSGPRNDRERVRKAPQRVLRPGPTKAKVYTDGDLLAVVLEETFTPAEKTLVSRNEAEGVQDIRRRFQRAMVEQFTAIVEQATGRKVRAFLSETNLEADVAVEIFLLADERTDMTAFEQAGEEADAQD